ncbi:MAG: CBS domain-containing protein [Thermodesulfobacteriota bacterium]
MLTVRDIMTREPVTVTPDTPVTEAAGLLLDRRINGLPVVDSQGKLAGIICQSDLVTQQKKFPIPTLFTLFDGLIPLQSIKSLDREVKKITATTVGEAMTADPVAVTPDMTVDEVASLMVDKKFHTLPVVDGETLVGVIGKEDVLRLLMRSEEG